MTEPDRFAVTVVTGTMLGPMTDHGGRPTAASRAVVVVLALLALGVGALWMWSTATGLLWAGVPSWTVGLVVVGLIVALALAVNRVHFADR